MDKEWNRIFNVTASGFENLALEIFQYQYQFNSVYKAYVDMLKIDPQRVNSLLTVPFLPIQFFKTHPVKTTDFNPVAEFVSSGTTRAVNSHHLIKDINLYRQSFTGVFKLFYGSVDNWCILGLLPSYLERNNSSLVYMVNELIHESYHPQSGFYLNEYEKLRRSLKQLEADKQKTLLIGVSYALLDFAEQYPLQLENTIVMETGGMKGRKPEIVRNELHEILKRRFH